MSRLIDVDALAGYVSKLFEYDLCHTDADDYTEGRASAEHDILEKIREQPTIDAIPVEWIDDRANDITRAPLYRRYMQMLIDEWQKEQEGEIVAEFSEVIKQFKRMCKSITPIKCTRGECPMGCENIGQCRKVAFERPAKFEEQVMSWAAEHPEPVYPTWAEWLQQQRVLDDHHGCVACLNISALYPIPADIAQKLGIEPKEDA